VIAHILLAGFPPFTGVSDAQIFHKILHTDLDLSHRRWAQISAPAKDFVRALLVKDPGQRMPLAEAMAHPWIADHNAAPDVPLSADILRNLQARKKGRAGGQLGEAWGGGGGGGGPLGVWPWGGSWGMRVPHSHAHPSVPQPTRFPPTSRQAFTHENKLRQMLMTLAARHLSGEAIGALRDAFRTMDADHDNLVGLADLTYGLQHAGIDLEAQGVAELLQGKHALCASRQPWRLFHSAGGLHARNEGLPPAAAIRAALWRECPGPVVPRHRVHLRTRPWPLI
jgi:hypothetical protein